MYNYFSILKYKFKYKMSIQQQYDFMIKQEQIFEGDSYKPWKTLNHPIYLIQASLIFGKFDETNTLNIVKNLISKFSIFLVSFFILIFSFIFNLFPSLFLLISCVALFLSYFDFKSLIKVSIDNGLDKNPEKINDFMDFLEDIAYPE